MTGSESKTLGVYESVFDRSLMIIGGVLVIGVILRYMGEALPDLVVTLLVLVVAVLVLATAIHLVVGLLRRLPVIQAEQDGLRLRTGFRLSPPVPWSLVKSISFEQRLFVPVMSIWIEDEDFVAGFRRSGLIDRFSWTQIGAKESDLLEVKAGATLTPGLKNAAHRLQEMQRRYQ